MSSEGNKDVPNEALSVDLSSISGAKRKRGRPRKYEHPAYELPQKVQPLQSAPPLHCSQDGSSMASHTSGGYAHGSWSAQPRNSVNASIQGNSGKDDVLGKHFVGKLTKKIPGFSLITVKVKDNQVLKGWVPDEINLRPITPKDDLAPELPMLRPSHVRKRASAIHMQTALTVPLHLEDITLAKPLQMRRPVEETIAKHSVPLAPRPYMGSGVVAPVPISVALAPNNPELTSLTRQDAELVIPQSSVAAVPITSVPPCKQLANQNEFTEKNYVDEFQKDSESRNVTKELPGERQQLNDQVTDVVTESSGQIQNTDATVSDKIKITSGARDQPNPANSEQHEQQSSKEPSDEDRDRCPKRS
ncbi:AT hook motif family protein isoform X3 [Zea mays]|uniref:AT hook motif family protein isoform X3 n=1 Tax=Zea mays TaxID=4577 RepID=UPI0004DEB61F|nr:AT hook motif family protein isoform X3 [Zea mays]|eukprot:XP_008661983.1 AT hook motif family protein isoform X3 [Zea mays]